MAAETQWWAHSANSEGRRHELISHLRATATLAASFARPFSAEAAGFYLGLWHDLGKFNPGFQHYLAECEVQPQRKSRGPDHKAAGTKLAVDEFGTLGMVVQGHHGGLHSSADLTGWLRDHSQRGEAVDALALARSSIPDLVPAEEVALPEFADSDLLAAEFLIRMLFSALVDADFLDTERHFRAGVAANRTTPVGFGELWESFSRHYQKEYGQQTRSVVNEVRRAVFNHCVDSAEGTPGAFRLTVPTGGGKTLAGMAFALRHAMHNGQQRVIVALPYVTITEQTAATYRAAFAAAGTSGIVLEHHSGIVDAHPSDEDAHAHEVWTRLAAENWDAPIVVTTTVQLFDSMFAANPSRCRKLHRLANSVIILDEAQALPSHVLRPILSGLRELTSNYGTSVVFSTATQPAFQVISEYTGVPAIEIVPEPEQYFAALRRVQYEWRAESRMAWGKVADLIRDEESALVVVNTRKDALDLLAALDDDEALHLSTLLCGAHRSAVLAEVKRRLDAGERCRLVSTQVVEAGVDLDFPLVLRAFGPLDSIIQAAGRCNRNGRQRLGRVVIFEPDGQPLPKGAYRIGASITRTLAARDGFDPHLPESCAAYFRAVLSEVDTDRDGVQDHRRALDFPATDASFEMIPPTESLVVLYGSESGRRQTRRLVAQLRAGTGSGRGVLRLLQPSLVSVRPSEMRRQIAQGLAIQLVPGVWEWLGRYDERRGIRLDESELIF